MKIKIPILILILMLGLISSRIVINQLVMPNIAIRIYYEKAVLSNNAEPPYQYRPLQPVLAHIIQLILTPYHFEQQINHIIAYSFILILIFLGIYFLMAIFLGTLFHDTGVIIGLLLFQSLVPLSISGFYMEGDYITVLCYLAVFVLMIYKKDFWIPMVIFIATFNREQSVFILIIYGIYLYCQAALDRKHIFILGVSLIAFLVGYWGIQFYFGIRPSQYTVWLHIDNNSNLFNLLNRTIPLWTAEVVGLVLLSILAFKKSDKFFKLSLICLGFYAAIFFFKGNLWEIAKFLPAFLILIPMGMQTLIGKTIPIQEVDRKNTILT